MPDTLLNLKRSLRREDKHDSTALIEIAPQLTPAPTQITPRVKLRRHLIGTGKQTSAPDTLKLECPHPLGKAIESDCVNRAAWSRLDHIGRKFTRAGFAAFPPRTP